MSNYTFSQKDPSWGEMCLPGSKMTMRADGCYVTSIAMLGQVPPVELLKITKGFQDGLVISSVLAKACGMTYEGSSKLRPRKTCIAVTDNYKNVGFSTHFFVLLDDGRMIDPLSKNPVPEPLKYNITEYRLFENVKLSFAPPEIKKSESVLKRLAARFLAKDKPKS